VNLIEYERMFRAEEAHWWYAGMREISAALLDGAVAQRPDGQPPRILDAGCGTGNNLLHFASRGRAVGVDLSAEALRFCRSRGVTVVGGNLLALPFPDASFDLVTSFDVLYHRWVTDDVAAVRELVRVLRPGGAFLVRVPALEALRRGHDAAVYTRHRYTRGELRALLTKAGLTVVRDTYCNSLLLPLVFLHSVVDGVVKSDASDLESEPGATASVFRRALALEARWVRRHAFPLGASVMAVAQRR
jgi:SAM-dependent methyltransferase